MSKDYTTPNDRTTFSEFLQSGANNERLSYLSNALSDAGITFPQDSSAFVQAMLRNNDGDDESLLSNAEELEHQLVWGAKLLEAIRSNFALRKRLEKATGKKVSDFTVLSGSEEEHFGTYYEANGMVYVTYKGRTVTPTQVGGLPALTVAEMLLHEVVAMKPVQLEEIAVTLNMGSGVDAV